MDLSNFSDEEIAISKEFSRAIDLIYVQTNSNSYEELKNMYEIIENKYVSKLKDKSHLILEVRRRVSEMKLYAAIDKELPLQHCLLLYDKIKQLGFSTLEKRGNVTIILARYCKNIGNAEVARSILLDLKSHIEAEQGYENSELYNRLYRIVSELLSTS